MPLRGQLLLRRAIIRALTLPKSIQIRRCAAQMPLDAANTPLLAMQRFSATRMRADEEFALRGLATFHAACMGGITITARDASRAPRSERWRKSSTMTLPQSNGVGDCLPLQQVIRGRLVGNEARKQAPRQGCAQWR